ncbi:MAG: type II secretion system inner membrane protein GspF [Candidatus Sumerlaeia bacterium]|nr:type II secretion system inner membrane protein GspF [Candidatus Sumerlaeia bacterium]
MPTFSYRAKDPKGDTIAGTMEADGPQAVTARLQAMGYFPLQIRDETQARKASSGLFLNLRRARIRTADLTTFNRQLADLLGAGITLVKALNVIVSQTPSEALREIINQVMTDVQGGDTLAKAMAKHPRAFSKLYVAMVRAGETGGMLENVLARLADFAEAEQELKGRVQTMLIYPVIMVFVGIAAIAVLMTVVMPKITRIYQDMNQTLPGITQALISISNFLGQYWWAVLAGIGVLIAALWRYMKTPDGKTLIDTWILQVPVLGTVVQKREIARFARTFGALLRNGVSILPALEIVIEVMTNFVVRREVAQIPQNISQGAGVAKPLRASKVFPAVVVNMIAIGEETGRLPDVLERVARSYEVEVDRSVRALVSLIEPLIILIMGLVVGFIVVAMLLPIFALDPSQGA